MPATKNKKVSERSTKLELWSAYNEAITQISGEEIIVNNDDSVNEMIKKLSETKININSEFDALTKSLLGDLSELYKTSEKIRQNKEELLKHFEEQKNELQRLIADTKVKWSNEERLFEEEFKTKKADAETSHCRQEEEYKYNLELSRKKEQDSYLVNKTLREKALADQENALAVRKKEIAEMEKQISEMPTLIESKVQAAEEARTKELTTKYQIEIKELTVEKDHTRKIYELNTSNLQATIKSQSEEIAALKSQLTKANDMMKDMAVSAIEAKKPTILSSKSNEDK
jgi:hypothetical protein